MTTARIKHAECCLCGETLTDPESIRRGTGPVCAAKLTRFLATAGSSAEEVAALALIDDVAVARWLRMVARALGAGRAGEAGRFLDAARKAAQVALAEVAEEKAA